MGYKGCGWDEGPDLVVVFMGWLSGARLGFSDFSTLGSLCAFVGEWTAKIGEKRMGVSWDLASGQGSTAKQSSEPEVSFLFPLLIHHPNFLPNSLHYLL